MQLCIVRIINDVDPVRFGHPGAVGNDPPVNRVFKCVRESGVEQAVFLCRQINPVIAAGLGNIIVLAGSKHDRDDCYKNKTGYPHTCATKKTRELAN
jgi:hypothetical protein